MRRRKLDLRAELRKPKYLVLAIVTAFSILFDQWTKNIILARFKWGETQPIIEGWFDLCYVRNTGAAFGFLNKAPVWFREPFFIVIPVAALFIILTVFARLKEGQRWTGFALSLITGGAIGNLIDRLRFGYVVDFLDFHYLEVYHWPAFNIADACIVVGVSILFVLSFFQELDGAGALDTKPRV